MRQHVYNHFAFVFFFILGFFALSPFANASHGTGADIRMVCLGGNTYQFDLTFFRDCAGITPTAPTLNISGCGFTGIIPTTQIGTVVNLPGICPGQSTCDGGTLPGVQQYTYRGTYTLPAQCADWTVSFGQCCRSASVSNLQSSSSADLYTEGHLNNLNITCNNSPDFTSVPVAYMCAGQPFTYNFGTFDPEGDEVVYSLAQPRTTAAAAVALVAPFTTAQPMCSIPAGSMVFNTQTGQLTITPCANQQAVLDVVATEYRVINGVRTQIGSVRRDVQVIVLTCGGNLQPTISAPSNITPLSSYTPVNNSGIFRLCPGTNLTFQVVVGDANAADVITAVAQNLPSTATVTQTGTNPKTLTFSWTPSASDVGQRTVSFLINDSACPVRGTANEGYTIIVQGVSVAASRATMCSGSPTTVSLTATATTVAGGTYAWSANPPVTFSPAGSAQTVTATITRPTTFTVVYNDNICNAQDTSIVTAYGPVSAVPATPSFCPTTDPPLQLGASYTNPAPVPPAACTTGAITQCTSGQSNKTIGTGAGSTATTGSAGTPYQGFWEDGRFQMLFLPSELSAAGVSPGLITRLGLNVTRIQSTAPYLGFTIKMGCTSATSLSAGTGFLPGTTTVYTAPAAGVTPILGTNTYTFQTPYRWDGSSSLVIEICYDNTAFTNYDDVSFTATAATTVLYRRADGSTGCTLTTPAAVVNRPDVILRNCPIVVPPAAVTYAWTVAPAAAGSLSSTTIANPTASVVGTPANGTVIRYIVQATDGTCTSRDTVLMTVNCNNLCNVNAAINPSSTELRCNQTTVSLNASAPSTGSGGGVLTYQWAGPAGGIQGSTTAGIITATLAGTYTVTVTNSDAGGCSSTSTVTVVNNTSVPVVTLTSDIPTVTCSSPTATVTANTSPNSTNYTYTYGLSGVGFSGQINTGVGAGSYAVTVTNLDNGCTTTSGVLVIGTNTTAPTVPASPSGLQLTCNNIATGISITTFATSTPTNVDFQWSGMPNPPPAPFNPYIQPTFTVTAAGSYTVTVINPTNGCTVSRVVAVSIDTLRPTTTLAANRTTITCTNPTATLTAQPSGVNYFTNWSTVASSAANVATVNTAGIYTTTVTSTQNGCTKSATIAIAQNVILPIADIAPPSTLNCTNAVTGILLDATGSTPGTVGGTLNYAWSGGGATGTKTVTTVGPWTVTITDVASGCTATSSVTVPQDLTPAVPTISASLPELTCTNTSLVLTATGGGNYTWSGAPAVLTATKTITTPGTYTVTVTEQFTGCTGTTSYIVTRNTTLPVVSITAPQVLTCAVTGTTVTAGGGVSYVWSGTLGTNPQSNTITAIGSYTVTATAANGCVSSSSVTVTNLLTEPTPTIATTPANTTELTCGTPSIVLTASGGDSFTWGATQNTAAITVTTPATYVVTATLTSTGCTKTASIAITQNIAQPAVTLTSNIPANTLNCTTQSGNLTATGGGTYRWDDNSTANPRVISAAGTYTVTVTATANGCTNTTTIVITNDTNAPVVAINPPATLTCAVTSIDLTATGATTYRWDDNSVLNPRAVTAIGIYTVVGTQSSNGCTASATVEVFNNITPPVITISPSPSAQLTCSTTQITLVANGGDTYTWSPNVFTSNAAIADVTQADTYTVTATATATGCTATATQVITIDNTVPLLTLGTSATNITCTTSTITLTATGGSSYNWSIPSTNGQSVVSVNAGGTYTVTATNSANNCTTSTLVVITQDTNPPTPTITPDVSTITCASPLAVLTSSGLGTDLFSWTTANGTIVSSLGNTATVSAGGTYNVSVTSTTNGCTNTTSILIAQDNAPPTAAINPPTVLNCTNQTITLTAQGGDVYAWAGPGVVSQSQDFAVINQPGTYTVTVTSSTNGCTGSTTTLVSRDLTVPIPSINVGGTLTCTGVPINLTASGGDTYLWSANANNATTPVVSVQNGGAYTVTATNAATGCTALLSATVLQDTVRPSLTITASILALNCTNPTAILTANSDPTYTYAWSANAGSSANTQVTVLAQGTYEVTVTNPVNSCQRTAQQVITQDFISPTVTITPSFPQLNCTITNIDLTAGGGDTYAWLPSGNTSNVENITAAGIYTVVATTTSNGCTASLSIPITQETARPIVTTSQQPAILTCSAPTVTLSVSASPTTGSVNFNWSDGTFGATATIDRPDIRATTANTFTVTATNISNGCSVTAIIIVPVDTLAPNVTITLPDVLTCARRTITLAANGASSYAWSSPATVNGVTSTIGAYTVTGTSASNGCTATAITTVVEDISVANPTSLVTDVTELNCQTLNANLTASGGDTYSWNGVVSFNANTAIVNTAGTYTVIITKGATGCTTTQAIVITQNTTNPIVSIASTVLNNTITCANPTTVLTANAIPATSTYAWSVNGSVTSTTTVNYPDNFTVTVTNPANFCTAIAVIPIQQDIASPIVTPSVPTLLTCTSPTTIITMTPANGLTFAWSGASPAIIASGATAQISVAGNYTVTATSSTNGCTLEQSIFISEDKVPPSPSIAATPFSATITCAETVVTLVATGGINCTWSPNAPTNGQCTISVTNPDTYTVQVANPSNGCTATSTFTVIGDLVPPVIVLQSDVTTIDCNVLQANLQATGGDNYAWSNGVFVDGTPSAGTAHVTTGGTYQVTATQSSNGCSATQAITINRDVTAPNTQLAADFLQLTCAHPISTITATTAPVTGVTYTWAAANGQATVQVTNPLTYEVTVVLNATGCSTVASIDITQDITQPAVTIATPALLTCTTTAVQLQATADVPATFAWDVSGAGNPYSVSVPASYTVTVTGNQNGCTNTGVTSVLQDIAPPVPIITQTNNGTITCSNPTLDLTVTGGTPNWGPILGTNPTITVAAAGTYTVTITNPTNGCIATEQSVVTDNLLLPVPTIASSSPRITCTVNTITLSANGAGANDIIAWSTNQATPTITITTGGSYIVTITRGDNGCSAVTSITVIQDTNVPIMTLNANVPTVTCAQPLVTLIATGGDSYIWASSTANGIVSANGGTAVVSAGGNYTVTATNNTNGCTNEKTINIGEDKVAPIATIQPPGVLTCATTSLILTAGTGDLYTWSNNVQSSTGNAATVVNGGNYAVTVTNTANGCKATTAITVGRDVVVPNASSSLDAPLSCLHPVTTLTGVGGDQYTWSSNVNTTSGANATTLSPGTFTVTATSLSNGCTASATTVVTQDIVPPIPTLVSNFTTINCSNPTASLSANANVAASYSWSVNVSTANNNTASVVASGIYTVTATSANNGCTASATLTINRDFDLPILNATITNVTCNGGLTGAIDLTATLPTGLLGVFAYSWSNGSLTEDLASLAQGQYCATVTGSNGCSQTACYIVQQPAIITATFDITDAACNSSATGGLTVLPTGGNGTYTYAWSAGVPAGSNAVASGLAAGTYTVTITDVRGCLGTATATVGQPTAILATATQTARVKCKGASNGQANVAISGGAVPYQVLWDSQEDSTLAVLLSVGVHTVTITDANQCSVTATVTITEPAKTVASISAKADALCYGTATGSMQASIVGGTAPYTFIWSDAFVSGGLTSTHLNLVVGTYYVTVSDINGCTATTSGSIGQPSSIFTTTTGVIPTLCAYSADGSATALASGGTPAGTNVYSYRWDSGELSNPAVALNKGTHSVTATDANGCTASTTFIVLGPDPISLNTQQISNVTCNGLTNGSVTVSLLGGTGAPNYFYAWSSGSTTNTQANLAAGTVTCTVTDVNGCTLPDLVFEITQPLPLTMNLTPYAATCNAEATGKIVAVANGGTTPYSFTWSTSAFGNPVLNLVAGTYSAVVTDANGCTIASTTTITEPTPVVATASGINAKCFGERNGRIDVNAPTGGISPYVYSLDGISFTTSNFFTTLPANTYTVYVQDANGCETTTPVVISSNPPIQVNAGADVIVPLGESTQLQAVIAANSAFTIAWTNPTSLSNPTISAPTASPTQTTLYTIIITDTDGCKTSDDVLVSIDKRRNIYIPTAFSPDGDGVNDYFTIYGGIDVLRVKRFMVFDRLGELLFEAKDFVPNDPRFGWDGKLRDQVMNTSVFVYYLEAEFKDGASEEFKGDVTLIK